MVGLINMILGAVLGMYTGVLLSSLGARPLWNSAVLWLLFLVSGLSSAAALVHLIADDKRERELLAKADNGFLILEIMVIAMFFIGLATASEAHLQAAGLLLGGAFAPVFWVLVMGLGILVPLIIQLLAVNHKIPHVPAAPILVIAGGLILRFVIVYAGQASHWPVMAGAPFGF
jgi:formate-dependent nitrite reductase membrane component NrfD